MWYYVTKRILATLPVMGVVAVIVFLLLRLSPGDPAAIIAALASVLAWFAIQDAEVETSGVKPGPAGHL